MTKPAGKATGAGPAHTPTTVDPDVQPLHQTHRIDANNPFRDPDWEAIATEARRAGKTSTAPGGWFAGGASGEAAGQTGWARGAGQSCHLHDRLITAALWTRTHLPADRRGPR
ncbi:MAG: hypothetical protein ACJ786_39855 [Catenulispora sp.]